MQPQEAKRRRASEGATHRGGMVLLRGSRLKAQVADSGVRRLRHLGHALPHFFGRDIFDVGGDRPHVAERIDDGAAAISIELISSPAVRA